MYLIVLELIFNYFPEEGLSCARFKYLKSQNSPSNVYGRSYHLPKDIYEGLKKAVKQKSLQLVVHRSRSNHQNAEIADAEDRPYCQDTGMTMVFLKVGQDVHFVGGDLTEAINAGVAAGYVEGYLRKSVVAEPLFNRKNTQNNTPAIIYT